VLDVLELNRRKKEKKCFKLVSEKEIHGDKAESLSESSREQSM